MMNQLLQVNIIFKLTFSEVTYRSVVVIFLRVLRSLSHTKHEDYIVASKVLLHCMVEVAFLDA